MQPLPRPRPHKRWTNSTHGTRLRTEQPKPSCRFDIRKSSGSCSKTSKPPRDPPLSRGLSVFSIASPRYALAKPRGSTPKSERLPSSFLRRVRHAAARAGGLDLQGPEGLLRIALKRPFSDGTIAVEMDPLSLLCRLAMLVPQEGAGRPSVTELALGCRLMTATRWQGAELHSWPIARRMPLLRPSHRPLTASWRRPSSQPPNASHRRAPAIRSRFPSVSLR